ncbi:hypothetical protein ACFSTI_20875 [Rhizorhabdus histidinilytica]|uniref:Uncharacterized protein n=1 Tax=Rhizorhabdus histidinilytica TaxID=439228 RepID=A0A1T5BN15_9SPHN|nr:hypothetical protein [Rhizorhabdus histidinilytica]SKB48535.1 hypothetical protein SAMN06295920_103134 [Rhizorhabdus histidinilytica]
MAGPPIPPFYVVWCEDGASPTRKHDREYQAEQEAKRLSRENPGKKFCVLAPVTRIVTQQTVIERFDASDDIPF